MFDKLRNLLPTSVAGMMDKGQNFIIQTCLNARYRTLGQVAGPVKDFVINRKQRCMDMALELNGGPGRCS